MSRRVIFENQKGRNLQEEKTKAILNPLVLELIKKYHQEIISQSLPEEPTIHVDEIASKVAKLYETIRRVVDWKEENILRRNATERILKRVLIREISRGKFIRPEEIEYTAEILVKELIRGGHLPNDKIPKSKIFQVRKIIEKYLFLLKNTSFNQNSYFPLKKRVNFYNWLLEIAACEIEENLSPSYKENALIKAMTFLMNERIKIIPEGKINEKEKFIQTFIAVQRTLFDLDDAIIAYQLLKLQFPEWLGGEEKFLKKITKNILSIWENLEKQLNHPLRKDFFNICEQTDTVFTLLGDILSFYQDDPSKIIYVLQSKDKFKNLIIKFYNQRLVTLKSRLFRIGVYSSLSVFFSNFFTYFIVEVPLANLFYEGFSFFAALVDFLIPTMVMFILVALIKPPRPENLNKVIEMAFQFIYSEESKNVYEIKIEKRQNVLVNLIIGIIYFTGGFFILGITAWLFYKAGIPTTSVILDTAMISLNVFAALIVRNKAKEITVEEKTTIGEFILDTLSVPVAKIGSFLAKKWKEYNIASVFLNAIVEVPFIAVVDFIENWSEFIKERKAEIH